MRKNIAKTLIASLCTAFVFLGAAGFFTAFAKKEAHADTTPPVQADELLIPSTYQQYLALNSPKDVAINENFTAIADGNIIYLYDETDEVYRKYAHEYHTANASSNDISKLQFDAAGNLYFLDKHDLFLLEYDKLSAPERAVATETAFSCTTFLIVDNTLYFTDMKNNVSPIYQTALVNLLPDKQNRKVCISYELKNATLAYWNDELYFTHKDLTTALYKCNPTLSEKPNVLEMRIAEFELDILSIAVSDGILSFVSNAKEFYAYALPRAEQDTLLLKDAGAYSALSAFGENIYAVNGQSVRQFSLTQKAFTSFEICSNSSQPNRLSGAADILQAGERLYIADNGNSRILVYNTATNAFETFFHADVPPSFMSADEDCLLVANNQKAVLYSLSGDSLGKLITSAENFASPIKGVAAVYGNYYIACEGYAYTLTKEGVCEGKEKTAFYPALFTSDIYGNLYTLQNGGILRFTESQFLSPDESGDRLCACPIKDVKKLAVDYKRDIYALTNAAAHKIGQSVTQTDFSTPIVYADNTSVLSFAFGVEENAAYILMDGNYLIKSARLNLPTVKDIAVQDADERIFSEQSAEIKVVKTAANTLFIEFDLQALQGKQTFPYLGYERKVEGLTALKMDETDEYNILAVFDNAQNEYHTYLVLKEFCEPLLSSEYHQAYEQSKTGYLTNAVSLYKFPYLCELLTVNTLPRGAQVTLIGEIGELDHEYYHISYIDETGEEQLGYIPKSYAVLFDGSPLVGEQDAFGATNGNKDAVWRLAYLILGFAAVCILTDYLLLRKKKDE